MGETAGASKQKIVPTVAPRPAKSTKRKAGGGVAFRQGAVAQDARTGQIVRSGALTDQQAAFCEAYISNGANGPRAARTAGYGAEGRTSAFQLLHLPKIRSRIHELVQIRLETKGGVVGYNVLMEIALDKGAPPGVRRNCARDLLELAGFYGKDRDDVSNPRKSLAEMSREELEEVVAHGAAVLTAASKVKTIHAGIGTIPDSMSEANTL